MKKYVKPELFYESFELSEQIAAGCSSNLLVHYDEYTCSIELGGGRLFLNSEICNVSEFEGLCYHNGGEGMTIFSS